MGSRSNRCRSRCGPCRRQSRRSSSTRCASPGSSAACGAMPGGGAMLTLEPVYLLLGAFLLFAAVLDFRSRRLAMAAFWAILSLPFLAGDAILAAVKQGTHWPAQAMGIGVIALGVMAALGDRRPAGDEASLANARQAEAGRLRNRLFGPALLIPLVTLLVALAAQYGPAPVRALVDAKQ